MRNCVLNPENLTFVYPIIYLWLIKQKTNSGFFTLMKFFIKYGKKIPIESEKSRNFQESAKKLSNGICVTRKGIMAINDCIMQPM